MNIIYRKNTLYVYLSELVNSEVLNNMESRVNNIMGTYDIDNLVINTNHQEREHFHEFETNYNSKHRSKVVIK